MIVYEQCLHLISFRIQSSQYKVIGVKICLCGWLSTNDSLIVSCDNVCSMISPWTLLSRCKVQKYWWIKYCWLKSINLYYWLTMSPTLLMDDAIILLTSNDISIVGCYGYRYFPLSLISVLLIVNTICIAVLYCCDYY